MTTTADTIRAARAQITTTPAGRLAWQIHAQLSVLTTAMQQSGVTDAVGTLEEHTPLRQLVEKSIAGLLLTQADTDHVAYAGMLTQDHIEAWENDGIGLTAGDLSNMLERLLAVSPQRHLLLTVDPTPGNERALLRLPPDAEAAAADIKLSGALAALLAGDAVAVHIRAEKGRWDA